jgi:hypothetical protein
LLKFYSQAVIPRTIVDFPAFLEPGSAEKIAVYAHTTQYPNKEECLQAQNFEVFTNIHKLKLKNRKPKAVDVLFYAYPMVPLS